MEDNTTNSGATGADDQGNKGGDGNQNLNNQGGDSKTGTDPDKKTDSKTSEAFDPSKVGDEDFNKVFDDPRLYKHSRFKELNDRAKKAAEYEQAEETRKTEELKKKGEFEALAKQEEEKRIAAEQKFQTAMLDNKIQAEASKQGAVDLEAVLKLIDRSGLKLNEDGTAIGIEESVKGLLESKPYLKGTNTTTIGSGTAPDTGNTSTTAPKFKLSQLQDATFYREHEKEIMEAQKAGTIENDMPM